MGVLSWARPSSSRHRSARPTARAGGLELVDHVSPVSSRQQDTDLVFAIAAEAVVLQDQAEAVLAAVGRGEHLGLVAPRGGPLVRRFFALRDALPRSHDPWLQVRVSVLDTILLHHAMQLATAMEFLAAAGRSDQLSEIVGSYGSLGRPAAQLEETYADLRARRACRPERVSDVSPAPARPTAAAT